MRRIIAACTIIGTGLFAGEFRGQEIYYFASLTGSAASPPNGSTGAGTALVYVDLAASQLHVDVTFAGLQGGVAAAHIHGLTALPGLGSAEVVTPEPTLSGFASGVTAGSYHGIFSLDLESTYSAGFLANQGGTAGAARSALLLGLSSGRTYFDIDTTSYLDGEISGFLAPAPTADFDHDGRVADSDLGLWQIGFGPTTFGNADHDADTDGGDFLEWQRQLGRVAEISHHHHGTQTVGTAPEPATVVVAATGVVWFAAARRGQARKL